MIRIMGTGSRQMLLHPDCKEIYANLEQHILGIHSKEECLLITGMAEGWDEAIAKVGMRNNIPYHCCIPNLGYGPYYWGKKSLLKKDRMDRFNELVANAASVEYVAQGLYVNGVHANFVRNEAMVDQADMALVYEPTSSGTRHAVKLLQKTGTPYRISPLDLIE